MCSIKNSQETIFILLLCVLLLFWDTKKEGERNIPTELCSRLRVERLRNNFFRLFIFLTVEWMDALHVVENRI